MTLAQRKLRRLISTSLLIVAVVFNIDALTSADPLHPADVFAEHNYEIKWEKVIKPDNPKDYIREVFGKDGENMIQIIGKCENSTFDQSRTNYNRNGTTDWGVMQINDANEKLCKGLDFRGDWKDNIKCGKRIYDSQGISAWSCSYIIGITPFWAK